MPAKILERWKCLCQYAARATQASPPFIHTAPAPTRAGILIVDYGVCFDFHQPFGIDETSYLHYGVGRTNVAEEFTMYLSDALPIFNTSEQYACANHIRKACACLFEC